MFIISLFFRFFWGGGEQSWIKSVKSTKWYTWEDSLSSLSMKLFLINIDVVKLFYGDVLFELLYFCCRSAYSDDWDIFTYTQEWPVAVCIKGKEEVKHLTQGFTDSRNYLLNNAAEFRSFLYIFLLCSTTLVLFHLACRDGEFTACGKHAILIFTYIIYILLSFIIF